MGYFPFFVDLKGKKGLIVGGGTIAYHKICKLLPYESDLEVIAKSFNDEILSLKDIYDQGDEKYRFARGKFYSCRKRF